MLQEWQQRGIVQAQTHEEELQEHLKTPRSLYAGFDPTADSLHVGSLLPLLTLRRAQLAGHCPIVLIGGATGLIGDPSGKAGERTLNTSDTVAQWTDKLKQQVSHFIEIGNNTKEGVIVNNYDWISNISIIEFLRDYGKNFSVNAMLAKESVKGRIEREGSGISFTEFSYMILQSLDFLELYKRYNCTLQIGGSDQWGNITAGVDLIRRTTQANSYGITLPLVVKADGTKFGKTESGTIWLDRNKTSPYQMYQFWLNTADEDTIKFLNYFTFLPLETMQELAVSLQQAPEKRQAQRRLAEEVTQLVHGKAGLTSAEKITAAFFNNEISHLNEQELADAFSGGNLAEITEATDQIHINDLLIASGAVTSKSQARNLIGSGGISINDKKISDSNQQFNREQAIYNKYFILKKGKKTYHLIEWKA